MKNLGDREREKKKKGGQHTCGSFLSSLLSSSCWAGGSSQQHIAAQTGQMPSHNNIKHVYLGNKPQFFTTHIN